MGSVAIAAGAPEPAPPAAAPRPRPAHGRRLWRRRHTWKPEYNFTNKSKRNTLFSKSVRFLLARLCIRWDIPQGPRPAHERGAAVDSVWRRGYTFRVKCNTLFFIKSTGFLHDIVIVLHGTHRKLGVGVSSSWGLPGDGCTALARSARHRRVV